jgi:hypothetical protein
MSYSGSVEAGVSAEGSAHVGTDGLSASGSFSDGVRVEGSAEGSVVVGTVEVGASVEGSAQSGLFVEGSIQADKQGLAVSGSFAHGTLVEASATVGVSEGVSGAHAEVTGGVTAQEGIFASASLEAGKHGVAAEGDASIGSSVGAEASVTVGNRYVSESAGAGVSIGEQLAIGGGAKATCHGGVVTVGVSGDVAALVGLKVDVGASVNVGQVAKDVVTVAKVAEKPVTTAVNTVDKAAKDTGKKISKGFKKTFHC